MKCKIKNEVYIFQYDNQYEIILKDFPHSYIFDFNGKFIKTEFTDNGIALKDRIEFNTKNQSKNVIEDFNNLMENFNRSDLKQFDREYPKMDDIFLNHIRTKIIDDKFKLLDLGIESCIALYRLKKEETNPTNINVLNTLKRVCEYLSAKIKKI